MADEEEWTTLKGERALALWRKGRSAWLSRINQNAKVTFDFSDIDFSREPTEDRNVSFDEYQFGEGEVYFWGTKFGNKDLTFFNARFGKKRVYFQKADFGRGRASFALTQFGEGGVSFDEAIFGAGEVSFSCAKFGERLTSFLKTQFGDGQLAFENAEFGENGVSFYGARFGNGDVSFENTLFGKGDVSLQDTTFGTGQVSFEGARLQGNLKIAPLESRKTVWSFRDCSFGGRTEFLLENGAEAVTQFDLRGARFDSSLTLRGAFGSVPDFRRSKVTHHVDLSEFSVTLRRKPKWKWLPWLSKVAEDKEDGARLRRLKEIAEGAKDHQKALEFAADENRANRWIKTGKLASVLDLAFSGFSNYGQSIMRPILWLAGVLALAMLLFLILATTTQADGMIDWAQRIGQSVKLSFSNSVPFLPHARDFGLTSKKALFGEHPSLWVDAIVAIQGILSFVFLFLIGLGLRNRFRL